MEIYRKLIQKILEPQTLETDKHRSPSIILKMTLSKLGFLPAPFVPSMVCKYTVVYIRNKNHGYHDNVHELIYKFLCNIK